MGWDWKGVFIEPGFISGQAINANIHIKMEFACLSMQTSMCGDLGDKFLDNGDPELISLRKMKHMGYSNYDSLLLIREP